MIVRALYVALVMVTSNYVYQCSCQDVKYGVGGNPKETIADMDELMDFHYPQFHAAQLMEPNGAVTKRTANTQQDSQSPYLEGGSNLVQKSVTGEQLETFKLGDKMLAKDPSYLRIKPPVDVEKLPKRRYQSGLLERRREREKFGFLKPDISVASKLGDSVIAPKPISTNRQNLQDNRKYSFAKRSVTTFGINDVELPKTLLRPQCTQATELTNAEKERIARFGADDDRKQDWATWHSNGIIDTVLKKREASNRRMKISDIWTKPKKENTNNRILTDLLKDETVTIILPVMLSELKDAKEAKVIASIHGHNITGGNSNVEGNYVKNFKVKSDDGKEFSFSASILDVQDLLTILSKPNSTVMLEKVPGDRTGLHGPSYPGRKYNVRPTSPHIKPSVDKEAALPHVKVSSLGDCPDLKETEKELIEDVVMMDIPCTSTQRCSTSCGEKEENNEEEGDGE